HLLPAPCPRSVAVPVGAGAAGKAPGLTCRQVPARPASSIAPHEHFVNHPLVRGMLPEVAAAGKRLAAGGRGRQLPSPDLLPRVRKEPGEGYPPYAPHVSTGTRRRGEADPSLKGPR